MKPQDRWAEINQRWSDTTARMTESEARTAAMEDLHWLLRRVRDLEAALLRGITDRQILDADVVQS